MNKTLYLCWENFEDRKHRMLHIFGSHNDAIKFVRETDGLREWNPGAHYHARNHEVENHDPNLTIQHT